MAATQILATAATAATSSDITIAAGASAVFFLKDADGGGIGYKSEIVLELKDDAANYTSADSLTNDKPSFAVFNHGAADMLIRWRRIAGGACGLCQI